MYQIETTVNGRIYTQQQRVWMNAYMDAVDIVGALRSQPSFAKPETKVNIVIKYVETDTIAATYSIDTGWDFR